MDEQLARPVDSAVGPAPWYLKTFPSLTAHGVAYSWRAIENDFVTVLEREGEATPVLALGFYARAVSANPGHVLLWRPERGALRVSVFELARLAPLEKGEWPIEQPRGAARRVVSRTPPVEDVAIRDGLGEGLHRYHGYRSRFADDRNEILLLGNGPSGSPAAASIYVWRPDVGEVEVLPQQWFTSDAFDLGYEWITRVVRDPRTGRLAGDGIRINEFELAADGMTLAE